MFLRKLFLFLIVFSSGFVFSVDQKVEEGDGCLALQEQLRIARREVNSLSRALSSYQKKNKVKWIDSIGIYRGSAPIITQEDLNTHYRALLESGAINSEIERKAGYTPESSTEDILSYVHDRSKFVGITDSFVFGYAAKPDSPHAEGFEALLKKSARKGFSKAQEFKQELSISKVRIPGGIVEVRRGDAKRSAAMEGAQLLNSDNPLIAIYVSSHKHHSSSGLINVAMLAASLGFESGHQSND